MTLVHVSAILSGIVADIHDMGHKSKLRAQRRDQAKGFADSDAMPYLLPTASQEMMEELLANMGIEGDLAGRQFVVQIQEEQGVVAFDDEGRMITSERSHA